MLIFFAVFSLLCESESWLIEAVCTRTMTKNEDVVAKYDLQDLRSIMTNMTYQSDPGIKRFLESLRSLVSTHHCFVAEPHVLAFPRQYQRQHQRQWSTRDSGQETLAIPTRPPAKSRLLNAGPQSHKELNALMNKVNESNFRRIYPRIRDCVFANVASCMPHLIERCLLQTQYLPAHAELFHRIHAEADPSQLTKICACIDSFVTNFVSEKGFLMIGSICDDYDEYCGWVKRRASLMARHKLVLVMMAKGLIRDSQDRMREYFESLLESLRLWTDLEHEEALELLVDMMNEFLTIPSKMSPDTIIGEWTEKLRSAYDDPSLRRQMSIKCQTKAEKILGKRKLLQVLVF